MKQSFKLESQEQNYSILIQKIIHLITQFWRFSLFYGCYISNSQQAQSKFKQQNSLKARKRFLNS